MFLALQPAFRTNMLGRFSYVVDCRFFCFFRILQTFQYQKEVYNFPNMNIKNWCAHANISIISMIKHYHPLLINLMFTEALEREIQRIVEMARKKGGTGELLSLLLLYFFSVNAKKLLSSTASVGLLLLLLYKYFPKLLRLAYVHTN